MRHVIWTPLEGEELPYESLAYTWCIEEKIGEDEEGNSIIERRDCQEVVTAIVGDDWETEGDILYDSGNPSIIPTKAMIHTWAGW